MTMMRPLRAMAFLVSFLAVAGCHREPARPRELPFPVIDAAAPFPELAVPAAPAAAPSQDAAQKSSAFEAALAGPPAGPAAAPAPPEAPAKQSVPLGGQLLGELPPDGAWRWSNEGGAVLIVHESGGRPTALIYVQTFTDEIHDRPSEEHHRFQVAVDPGAAEDHLVPEGARDLLFGGLLRQVQKKTGLDGSETARFVQLVTTRTAGRGLGFRPAPDSFTGWRWVGRNEHGVTLRLGRHTGSWTAPPPLPARFVQALARLNGTTAGSSPETAAAPAGTAAAIPAYLVLGSVTDRYEETGIHLALLCARSPVCAEAQDLADFLASLQPADAGRLERLLSAPPAGFADLAREARLEILPADQVPTAEGLVGKAGRDEGQQKSR